MQSARIFMYFEELERAAYIERIPAGLSHWLVADGEDSHFMIICSAGMTSEIHDIKHEYTLHILMFFECKFKKKTGGQKYEALILHKYISSSLVGKPCAV